LFDDEALDNLIPQGAITMATKKKAAKKAKSKGKKKLFEGGGDPIVVGGGGGSMTPKSDTNFTYIHFNRSHYPPDPGNPNDYRNIHDSLASLLIYANGLPILQQPLVRPNSQVVVRCQPVLGNPVSIRIHGMNLGVVIPGGFVNNGISFYGPGLKIIEVLVQNQSVFTSADGDCSVWVMNHDT
jgi:hypothetical protein